jgi:ribosome-associated translation inhibitor RaiA
MKTTSILSALLMLAALAGATGCGKKEEMGPVQKAGKAVDDVGEKVADQVREKLSKADEAAAKVVQSADEAREKIEDATRDASKGIDKATKKVGKQVERAGEKLQDAAR